MAQTTLLKLEDVYFYYTKIAKPEVDSYDPEGLMQKYSITVALTKAQAKEFKKHKLNKTVKDRTEEEFLKSYKVIPEALKNDDDEYFIISFTNKATYADGNPRPDWTRPKTYLWQNEAPVEATETLVGNGSRGDLRIKINESKTGQLNTELHSILVYDLVPFERRGDEWASAAANQQPAEDVDVPF